MNHLDYLAAELAQAQQLGIPATMIKVSELQSLLDQMRNLMALPKDPVRVCGFAKPGDLKALYTGTLRTVKLHRTRTEWHTQAVYNEFKESP